MSHQALLLALLLGGGCTAGSFSEPDGATVPDLAAAADLRDAPDAAVPGDLPLLCRTDKLAFTKDQGCQNDGSVEFCLPSGDPPLLARVQRIAPAIRCSSGGGRARCDVRTELLCFFPTSVPDTCVARYGALTEGAWGQLCELAALPEIRKIVPTWLE